ncbi:N-6 DNA methylase [Brachyspira catarrhinii]|uniref:site-specific DNA-methyltransferase (adenine-specific) n=1 Tax=Brachyspira catarrhinii TaxID=2528966 RepID=A0ABY2TPN5_9SPIR|nr:N-6 DNA methylase [Brachyspira catarrhinii]TKZ33345.1 hypothetical protein EZH24_08695 [Brachyspira catarrhinii]
MKVSIEYIKKLLYALGYREIHSGIFNKKYKNNYTIIIDFEKEKIFYIDNNFDKNIKLGDETTSNFENSENFVVLECVDRLLEKGYSPDSITLEKKWEMGRKEKGKLDILISKDNVSYLMIECKTWGNEFNKEYKNMINKKGGQLFSYYNQDRNAEYLCLYTSRLNDIEKIEYKNEIVKIDKELKTLANVVEIYNRWNKQFSFNGIFEEDILPYGIQAKALLKKDLKPITPDDSKKIYNQFLEILRHNVVSDKPNAFNKIFNLFVCKVFDEEYTRLDEELSFQWIEISDNYEIFIDRLNILFKKGMNNYLKKDIFYISIDEIDKKKESELKEYLKKAMIYKNQEFSFIDIFDKKDFKRNAFIVKEVVELLQGYQFRYTEKHQFLGDFFENLLNTGFKQEVGQFFTPRILTRFIVQSLPIKEIMVNKILEDNIYFIPHIIDFACGSGHFLTEVMDIIKKGISDIWYDVSNCKLKILEKISETLHIYDINSDKFSWAKDYIYGIENDYRLVKTTKLSCFFNGDGEAQILQTSGIYPFTHDDYRGTLLDTTNKENEKFDIVISNPPYSVSGFKSIMDRNSDKAFDLYKYITDSSKEIEVIFIERMKQLLKPNGYAAIILPVSILQNDGLYEKARTIIFENFYLKGIVKLGDNAFQATNTSTVVLFLQKREKSIRLENKESYINMCKNKKLLIIDTGKKEDEKKFLGYSFSTRRGSEGITEERDKEGRYLGSLLDEKNRDNINKANYYMLQAFYNNYPNVVKDLEKNIYVLDLEDCFNFEADNFLNSISLTKKKIITTKYPLVKLSDNSLNMVLYSGSRPKGGVKKNNEGVISLGGEHINAYTGRINLDKLKYIPIEYAKTMPINTKVLENDILICKDGALTGKIALAKNINNDMYINEHILKVRFSNEVNQKFIFYYLFIFNNVLKELKTGAAQGGLNRDNFGNLSVPIPPIEKQKEIVSIMDEQENIILEQEKIIKELNNKIISFDFSKYKNKSIKLNEIISLEYGISLPEKNRILGEYPVYGSNGIVGYHNKFLVEAPNIIIGRKGSAGEINFANQNFTPIDTTFYVKPLVLLEMKYLFYLLKTLNLPQYRTGLGSGGINRQFILNLDINYIDAIEKQKDIVSKLEKYEQEIEQAQLKIDNAKIKQREIMDDIFQID